MTTIKLRRGTASQWTTINPVLAAGEPGFETDTGKHKIGDGISAWTALEYFIRQSELTTQLVALNSLFLNRWKASTAYSASDLTIAPDGIIIQRIANGTSRSTYDSTEQATWTKMSASPSVLDGGGA